MSAAAPPLRLALVGNPELRQDRAVQPADRQPAEGRQLRRRHRRAQGRPAASRRPAAATRVLDLPGAYSLHAASLDEAITRDLCRGFYPGEPAPDVLVCVVDATNLRLHLRFVLEVRELGRPMVVALNMADAAQAPRHRRSTSRRWSASSACRWCETVAVRRDGARALVAKLDRRRRDCRSRRAHLPARRWRRRRRCAARRDAPPAVAGGDACRAAPPRIDDALDRWLLHPVFGLLTLAVVMFLIFQAVYAWADADDGRDRGRHRLARRARSATRCRRARCSSLLVDGIIAGLGGVIVFLPQILILFAFILALEESGYLPRAAFLLDRMMAVGRAVGPLVHSAAVELRLRDPRASWPRARSRIRATASPRSWSRR